MDKIDVLSKLKKEKLVAVIRADSIDEATKIIDAVVAGGINFIEITFTVPKADILIEKLSQKYEGTDVVLGAGTCLDSETARIAILRGAKFVVSPNFNRELVKICNRYGIPIFTGAQTVNEMLEAVELGVEIIKLFPASEYSTSIIKSIKGPIPNINIMPTGGINTENVKDWFEAGAFAVGTGGSLTKGAKTGDFELIIEETKKFVKRVQNV